MTPEQWNERYPIGTPVRVTSVQDGHGQPAQTFDTVTRSECWALGHGTPVVLVQGKTGGYSVLPGWMDVIEKEPPGNLPTWVRLEFHQKHTCAIWSIMLKDANGKWHVGEAGTVEGPPSSSFVGATVRAKVCALHIVDDVRQCFANLTDCLLKNRSHGSACWWWGDGHNRITAKGVFLIWESAMNRSEFRDHAYAALQLDEHAPTD